AGLPRPREVALRVAAEPAGEDGLERVALLHRTARVQIQDPRPRRPRLIVAVPAHQRDRQAGQVGPLRRALVDQPRQHPQAHAMRGPSAGGPVDPTAGTDRVAVARLEVRTANPPAHRLSVIDPWTRRTGSRPTPVARR